LDMSGNVVGVITMGIDPGVAQNLNFAVPSDVVVSLILVEHEPLSFESAEDAGPQARNGSEADEGSRDRERASSLFKDGSAALEAKEYERAIHLFQESVRLNPDDAYGWHGLGLAHFHLDQYDQCLTNFLEATKRNPKDAGLWRSVGAAYSILKKYPDALSAYQEAVGIDPRDASAWYGLGLTYDDLHNYEQAIRGFKQAVSLDPLYSDAWYKLGAGLNVLGRYDESVPALRKAVDINPDYADAWYFLGSTYNDMKRYDEAIAAWKTELGLKSKDASISDASLWSSIGNAYYSLSDLKNAEQATKKALDLEVALPSHSSSDDALIQSILLSLYVIYNKMGKHREADQYMQSLTYLQNHK
jgi:tetratricopeptide (TPR) repeat protein